MNWSASASRFSHVVSAGIHSRHSFWLFLAAASSLCLAIAIAVTATPAGGITATQPAATGDGLAIDVSARAARCARDAGFVADSLAGEGIDLRSTHWQQRRERAIRACRDGFSDLRWLLANP